jgi:4-hydroxybenzoate polyprenyltransferase
MCDKSAIRVVLYEHLDSLQIAPNPVHLQSRGSALVDVAVPIPTEPVSADLPLVVDLDGTLLLTDTLDEQAAFALFHRPCAFFTALPHLASGRAALKGALAGITDFGEVPLPIRNDLLAWLQQEAERGRAIHLCSAASQSVVDSVAGRLGIFATATGSGDENLKGRAKADYLSRTFPRGFVYVGDSAADLPVWQAARGIVLAGANRWVTQQARNLRKPVEAEFISATPTAKDILKALRVHHWAKNALIFVPMVLAHAYTNPRLLAATVAALVCLLLVTSATYLINDVSDLQADRRHWSKRHRAIASGRLSIRAALGAAVIAIVVAFTAAMHLSPIFALVLLTYLALTLAYSFGLKRIPLLDTLVIGILFTTRLVMGMAVLGHPYSEWLLTFSVFFFTSLAIAKRHTEIVRAAGTTEHALASRGYRPQDAPVTLSFGIAASVASLLILVLFLVEELFHRGTYAQPRLLLAVPLLLAIWIGRIWLLAHRGEMRDDPVSFALRDRASIGLGFAVAFVFVLAL